MSLNYSTIKQLAAENGLTVASLLALAPKNDPFYVGRPAQVAAGEWFADLWNRFGYSTGVHLRRVHYRLVSQPITRPDGQEYENTDNCWGYLVEAGKAARYLGLVDPEAFIDRRNNEPEINARWRNPGDEDYIDPTPNYEPEDVWADEFTQDRYQLPELPALPYLPSTLPQEPYFRVSGYLSTQQTTHIEIWCEKTTMNDVLTPLCQQYGVNFVTGAGELSITAVVDFMRRVQHAHRPARILYISDYDPAGYNMPVSIARKIEHFQRNEGFGMLDIRLQPIVLTPDQVAHYNLPRTPIKKSDLRKDNWEAIHNKGAVELDALEALYPGELRTVVEGEILKYYDKSLSDRAYEALEHLQFLLDSEHEEVIADHRDEIETLDEEFDLLNHKWDQARDEFEQLTAPFREIIEAHRHTLEGLIKRHKELCDLIADDLAAVEVAAPDVPEASLPEEPDTVLYDGYRDYVQQLASYKLYKNGIDGRQSALTEVTA